MDVEKIEITPELVDEYVKILKSPDKQDHNLVLGILSNRNKSNPTSEAYFKEIIEELAEDDGLFSRTKPKDGIFVVRRTSTNEILQLGSGKASWGSKGAASSALNNHIQMYAFYKGSAIRKIFESSIMYKNYLLNNDILRIEQVK